MRNGANLRESAPLIAEHTTHTILRLSPDTSCPPTPGAGKHMADREDINDRRIVPWYSNENLQLLRRRIAWLKEEQEKLQRNPKVKPADDNPDLMCILFELKTLSEAAEKVARELEDRGWTEWDELSLAPPPMDPSWIWNDSQ